MIRDPRDVITSMMKLMEKYGPQKIPWAAHPNGAIREIQNALEVLTPDMKIPFVPYLENFSQIQKKDPRFWTRKEMILTGALCWAIKNKLIHAYEKEGIAKLNPVCRTIFAKNCPFPQGVREPLARSPAFEKILRVEDNLRKKKLDSLQGKLPKLKEADPKAEEFIADALRYYRS